MKRQYDFSKARRGPVVPLTPGKTRITIRLDNDVIEHFQATVDRAGGGNYETLINDALREYPRCTPRNSRASSGPRGDWGDESGLGQDGLKPVRGLFWPCRGKLDDVSSGVIRHDNKS